MNELRTPEREWLAVTRRPPVTPAASQNCVTGRRSPRFDASPPVATLARIGVTGSHRQEWRGDLARLFQRCVPAVIAGSDDATWLRDFRRCEITATARSQTDRARAYLAKLPPAVAGQSGHAATFAAACRLVEFGLSYEVAWALLLEWNGTHCQPPWCERDLRHKLADAFRRTSPKAEFAEREAGRWGRGQAAPFRPPLALPPRPQACRRPQLPPMDAGTADQITALAELRGLSSAGVALASARGVLRFGNFRGLTAWFVTDKTGRAAQARRLDGRPWAEGVKAWTLPGSQAKWPLGIGEAENFPVIALCEGGPDLLAAHAFIVSEGREADCAAVGIMGASCPIHKDSLPLFSDKRVRVFRHIDEPDKKGRRAGDVALTRWVEQLTATGADVDAFNFAGLRTVSGADVKDLNDLARVHPDDFEQHPCLRNLFP